VINGLAVAVRGSECVQVYRWLCENVLCICMYVCMYNLCIYERYL